jgi:ubiquinone/menaquinone biosynthesis C-methylase UbiE
MKIKEKYLNSLESFWSSDNIDFLKTKRIWTKGNWENGVALCVDAILKDVDYQKEWKVLDVGCGIGRIMKPLSRYFSKVYGADISESMVNAAKRYLKNIDNVKVFANSGEDFCFCDNEFDFVYSVLCFQHIALESVVLNILKEIKRVMKKDGTFRLQLRIRNEQENLHEWTEDKPIGFRGISYTEKRISEYCDRIGFKIQNIDKGLIHPSWYWFTIGG